MQEASERGGEAIGNIFVAALDGADAAKQAVAQLLLEIAKAQMMAGAMQLIGAMPGGSGFLSWVGGLTGARASGGGVKGGGAYLVNEGTPNSEVFVPSQNGAILNVQQAQAALRGQQGGQEVKVDVAVSASEDFNVRVRKEAAAISQSHVAAANKQMPDRIRAITKDPRKR